MSNALRKEKGSNMNWLFWKEYRQNRIIVFALLFLLILPHLCGLYAITSRIHSHPEDVGIWKPITFVATLYSFAISQIGLALIGGNAIAGERVDRSAEFLAYLPLTKQKILSGKLLMALSIAGIIWLTNPPLIWGLLCSSDRREFGMDAPIILEVMTNIAITGLIFFCVSWLLSSIFISPTFSIVGGLVFPLILWSLIMYTAYLICGDQWHPPVMKAMEYSYQGLCVALAPICFGLGTWLYLRRVEP
jgi:ABC-type transport system involved in multi-copper enzyme maturation permease subunit